MSIDLHHQLDAATEKLLAAQREHLAAVAALLKASVPAPAAAPASGEVSPPFEPLEEGGASANAHPLERPADAGAAVVLPDDFPTELALTKGKLTLVPFQNVNGSVRVALSHIGPRGGENKLGNLIGTPDGNWQATTKVGKDTKSQTEGSWREALDWVLVVHELQPGEPPATATPKPPSRGEIAAANDRVFAGEYVAGDGRLILATGWQRSDNCLNVANFLRVPKDTALEMIERITGTPYNASVMVDAEALVKEIAGYHHDRALFGLDKPKEQPATQEEAVYPPLVDGIDLHGSFGGDNPDRYISQTEEAYARERFAEAGITTDEAQRQVLQDECNGTPSLDVCKLSEYKHLIYRVLPAKRAAHASLKSATVTDADRDTLKQMALAMGLNLDELRKLIEAECQVPDLVMLADRKGWEHMVWNVLPAISNQRLGNTPGAGDQRILDRVAALGIDVAPPAPPDGPHAEASAAVSDDDGPIACPRCGGGAGLAHTCSCSIEELQAHARGEEPADDDFALLA